MINLNAKIILQKLKLKLYFDYLVIIPMQSILPKYNALLNILNTKKKLIYDKTYSFLQAKKIELLDIGTLKKKRLIMLVKMVDLFEDMDFIEVNLEVDLEVNPKVDLEVDPLLKLEYNFCKYQ